MVTDRASRVRTGSNKVLWTVLSIVILLVLGMGLELLLSQSRPEEPQLLALPAGPAPSSSATVANAATQAASASKPIAPASKETDQRSEASRPRRVQADPSEPAMARTQADDTRADMVKGESRPGVKR